MLLFDQGKERKHTKTIWITGASSGLAKAAALSFSRNGWKVVAGARSFSNPDKQLTEENIHCLPLDVTDEESCAYFVKEAFAISKTVDALLCAAAILILGSCEMTMPEEYSRVMDTNFIGIHRIVSRVLPSMRAAKAGRILFFSSINGLMGIPFQSAYTASKHAIEGYAECLQMELAPYGIQIGLIEPGDHQGGSQHTRLHAVKEDEASPYAKEYREATEIIARDEAGGLLPQDLGDKLVRHIAKKKMPFRLRIAKPDQHLGVWLHKYLPFSLNAKILRNYYQCKSFHMEDHE